MHCWCWSCFSLLIVNRWCILIGVCTWVFNDYLNWNFVFRAIWVSDNDYSVFVTFSCCINWCLVLKLSSFWKITDITDGILGIWLVAWFNRLIFRSWCVLIRICTWIFDCYLNWNFIFRTVWVSDDNCSIFVTFSCCVNRCLVLELSAFWKITNITDGILGIWLVAWFYRLIFSYRSVLIRIRTWIFNDNLNWNFVFRTVWVSDNNCCVFFAFCCCVNRCLVFELSTFWKITNVAN